LVRIYTPDTNPGFLGAGHMARPVIQGDFRDTDPFILLMDDMLDKKNDEPVGGLRAGKMGHISEVADAQKMVW
jgi:quercetin 2,3-dioxygenase